MENKQTVLNEAEVDKYRSETAGTKQLIHFNNAGASLPPDTVVQTIIDYLGEEAAFGGYETEAKHNDRLERVYDSIARLVGADADEIAIFENASMAWLTAFKGIQFNAGDEIITSELEYVTNLIGLIDIQAAGVKVIVIGHDEQDNYSLDTLEAAITSKTKLIAVTHIPSSGGSMLPIEAIGRVAKKHGVLYLVDACQTVGHYPINVNTIGCDLLSATGRKYLRAPRGTGFLYVRKEIQDYIKPTMIDFLATKDLTLNSYELRADARRLELFEKNRALTLGLGKAVEYALEVGPERIWATISSLATYARSELKKIKGLSVHDRGEQLCGIVTFSVDGIDSRLLQEHLIARGINVSFGGPSATLIYMRKHKLSGLVRASLHYYNTRAEIDTLCKILIEILHLDL